MTRKPVTIDFKIIFY
ncbi:putative transposase, partial [Ligilactobacillus salivarius cp400]